MHHWKVITNQKLKLRIPHLGTWNKLWSTVVGYKYNNNVMKLRYEKTWKIYVPTYDCKSYKKVLENKIQSLIEYMYEECNKFILYSEITGWTWRPCFS